jgi:hypothetical protein
MHQAEPKQENRDTAQAHQDYIDSGVGNLHIKATREPLSYRALSR